MPKELINVTVLFIRKKVTCICLRGCLTKNFRHVIALLFVFAFLWAPFCCGQEIEQPVLKATVDRPPPVNINTSFYSHYIWRGYELSHDSFVMAALYLITIFRGLLCNRMFVHKENQVLLKFINVPVKHTGGCND
jgi:hypothetical protein